MEQQITHLLSSTPFSGKKFTLTKLAGQASNREYFRLTLNDDKTLIVMKMPQSVTSISEEITKANITITELPFINVHRYLKSLTLPVPEIYAFNSNYEILILEDIGDESLEKCLVGLNSNDIVKTYKKAIDLLVDFQNKTTKNTEQKCIAFSRSFDADLLNWEFDHFREYGLEDRFAIKLAPEDIIFFNTTTRCITQKITAMPKGLVHRDFQSRNLHFYRNNFWMIDFQDALLGPLVYDLVALLRDSYIRLNWQQIDELQNYYVSILPETHPYFKKTNELKTDFDLVTIQRKLKDTGRFQYIKTVKGNPDFLKHVPNSLAYVKEALLRHSEYTELINWLSQYLTEFKKDK